MLTNLKHPKILNLVKIPMFYVLQGQWSSKIQRVQRLCVVSGRPVARSKGSPQDQGLPKPGMGIYMASVIWKCVMDKSYK